MAEEIRVTVIGGGSSGMMAAISAARGGAAVTLLERKDRVGKKLLATGNGRCNLTNTDCSPVPLPRRRSRLHRRGAVALPGRASAVEFFEELGIACVTEDEGRIYPRSGQASAVLDVLRWELERLQVDVRTGYEVSKRPPGEAGVRAAAGRRRRADGRAPGPGLRRHGRAAVRQRRLGAAPGSGAGPPPGRARGGAGAAAPARRLPAQAERGELRGPRRGALRR